MLVSALMLFVLLVMILLFSVLTSIWYAAALSMSLLVRFWSTPLLPPKRSMLSANCRLLMGLPPMEIDVCGHGVFPAWSSLGTSWIGWVRVSIPDRHLLLSWRTPPAVCSRGLHCWSSHSAWLVWTSPFSSKLPRTCHRLACQTLSKAFLKSRSCGIDHTGVVSSSLWWLDCWRSVLLCSGLV